MPEIVHCPKCRSAVSVRADQAGQRVQCPGCLKPFLAPSTFGGGGASDEDEDWLKLDDSPAVLSSSQFSLPPLEVDPFDDDPFAENPFVDESPGQSFDDANHGVDPSDLFADLPPIDGKKPAIPEAGTEQAWRPDEEFRVTCPICGSLLFAKAKQAGRMIKCGDCYSEIQVPDPPKKKTAAQNVADAETFVLSELSSAERPSDPFKKNAADLLKEAARDPDEDRSDPTESEFDAPDMSGWFKSVFGIWIDPGVILHFAGLALLLGVPVWIVLNFPILALGVIPLALLGMILSVACGFAILTGVANEHDRIEDWPTVDPTGWFDSVIPVMVATAISVGPSFVIGTLFGAPPVIKLGMVMITVYAAFPIILLSMLDMQSVTSPFSPDVGKSITRCQEEWGAFYFSAGILFGGLYTYFLLCPYSPASLAIGVVLAIAVVFMYFAILGRLALAISNVIDLQSLDTEEDETKK